MDLGEGVIFSWEDRIGFGSKRLIEAEAEELWL